ncbi:hypothetical protein LJR235_004523 [Pararhizobium sp. LjRoot235]|uniref:hypothetical protein n=1 Tax=Pararhizobium sp. LjRoot235 TaxID=3342291 RepID=UPI003ED09C41
MIDIILACKTAIEIAFDGTVPLTFETLKIADIVTIMIVGIEKTVKWYLENHWRWQPLCKGYDGSRLGLLKTASAK